MFTYPWFTFTIPISLRPKHQLKLATTSLLSTNFDQLRYKKFELKLIILIIGTNFPKKGISDIHIQIILSIEFHLKLTILIFWTKFAQKEHFRSKTKKVNNINESCIFELGQVSFWTKFAQKGYVRSKAKKKVIITIELWIFELVEVSSFILN